MTAPVPGPDRAGIHIDDEEVVVGRPPDEVFAFLGDPQHLPAWRTGVKRARRTAGPSTGHGATYELVCTVAGRPVQAAYEVTSYEPVESLSTRMVTSQLTVEETFRLDGTQAPTTLHVSVTAQPHRRWQLLAPLVRLALRRWVRTDLRRLEAVLTGPAPAEPAEPEPLVEPEPEPEAVVEGDAVPDELSEDETATK